MCQLPVRSIFGTGRSEGKGRDVLSIGTRSVKLPSVAGEEVTGHWFAAATSLGGAIVGMGFSTREIVFQ